MKLAKKLLSIFEEKTIGLTKSGKRVYDTFDHKSHADFSSADHKDAKTLHIQADDGLSNEHKKQAKLHDRASK